MTRPTFFGASVKTINSSIGWNEQKSQLTAFVVEDPANNDVFTRPLPGIPAFFSIGDMKFNGIVQNWKQEVSEAGKPVYSVVVEDPRDILDGAQLIIGNYNGSVQGLRNVVNCYGYQEFTKGFGGARVNENGMPWTLIKEALQAVTNRIDMGTFGGPLIYRGITYKLDLSQLPIVPLDYRLNGTYIGLMDAISEICRDAATDYFISLEYANGQGIIVIRTVGRRTQPPLGVIDYFIRNNSGEVKSSNHGVEGRHEITSSFLIGGPQTTLFQSEDLTQFWGFDVNGNGIVGNGTGYDEEMILNCVEISDLMGRTDYKTNVFELCFAIQDFNNWMTYLCHRDPQLAKALGAISPREIPGVMQNALINANVAVQDKVAWAKQIGLSFILDRQNANLHRIHQFVLKHAYEYMGKKFLVRLPDLKYKVDDETGQITFSDEPTDSGYVAEGAAPLGLSELNEERFRNDEGKIVCFVKYNINNRMDFSHLHPDDVVVENNAVYLRATLDRQIIIINQTPYVLVSVSSPIMERPIDPTGPGWDVVARAFGTTPPKIRATYQNPIGGTTTIRLNPLPFHPDAAAVPMKSNQLVYGPWAYEGSDGKTQMEQDTSLVPGIYGGYANLNLAAQARVVNAVSNMTLAETGQLELTGLPRCSLGQILQFGGPQVTQIQVSYGRDGFTTSYSFQTYTSRFGTFGKTNADRIKRIAQTSYQMRRLNRQMIDGRLRLGQKIAVGRANLNLDFMANMPNWAAPKSPHTMFMGQFNIPSGTVEKHTFGSTMTMEESVMAVFAHDTPQFRQSAGVSFNGLFRPFTTSYSPYASGMPGYTEPSGGGINSSNYNPFQTGCDIEHVVWGDEYEGMHAFAKGVEPNWEKARPIALRGPVVLNGWGKNIIGEAAVTGNYLRDTDKWKVGPIDHRFDQGRGVWTSQQLYMGLTGSGGIPANSSGLARIDCLNQNIYALNPFSTGVSGNKVVMLGWFAEDSTLKVIAADCP